MMRAHQRGAGQPRALPSSSASASRRRSPAARCRRSAATDDAVIQLHHATVVVAPAPAARGPEHPHIQSLPMPLLTSAAGLGSRCKGKEESSRRTAMLCSKSLPVARVIPVSVADDQGVDRMPAG